jgi:hypothetical protein
LEVDEMIPVPDKFPEGCSFHVDRSDGDWVEFPDGKVFKLDDESGMLKPRKSLPAGSLQGSLSEAAFISVARQLEAYAAK